MIMKRMIGDIYFDNEFEKALKQHGAFFAFSEEQFNRSKVDGIKYVRFTDIGGLICPKDNAQKLYNEINEIIKTSKKMNIEKHGINYIIDYELENYEAYYTRDYNDAYNMVLRDYEEITLEMVKNRYYENINSGKYDDWV